MPEQEQRVRLLKRNKFIIYTILVLAVVFSYYYFFYRDQVKIAFITFEAEGEETLETRAALRYLSQQKNLHYTLLPLSNSIEWKSLKRYHIIWVHRADTLGDLTFTLDTNVLTL